MLLKLLKPIRIIFSLIFFFLILLLFVDFWIIFSATTIQSILFFQFVPSLLNFIDLSTLAFAGFLFVLMLTFLFGRVYCSTICPLGTIHDLIGGIWRRIKKKKYKYQRPRRILAYSILAITLATLIARENLFTNLLDPYGLSGKMLSALAKPAFNLLNNGFSRIFQLLNNYSIHSIPVRIISMPSFIFSLMIFLLIFTLALFKNRLYCNSICPVGTLLGIISKRSLLKITLNHNKCNNCGLCPDVCKAGCIDIQKQLLEFDRCVACFNCIGICKEKAIDFKISKIKRHTAINKNTELSRRQFIQRTIIGTAGIAGLLTIGKILGTKSKINSIYPITPPGSISYWNFSGNCISCHLCVSVCPTQVIQPSIFEYGLTGMFQPKMDYHTSYCIYDCVICGQICPSGAIRELTREIKHRTQIGKSVFIKNMCIVVEKNTKCGVCAINCPTKAIKMIPFLDNLQIPSIDVKTCNGCGACEYFCPTKPEKAIYVESNKYHYLIQDTTRQIYWTQLSIKKNLNQKGKLPSNRFLSDSLEI